MPKFMDSADGGFLSFNMSAGNSSNGRDTSFNSSTHRVHKLNNQSSPYGSPQGFSSPVHNYQNYSGNQRQNGYNNRFRGNSSGKNWKNRSDNKKPFKQNNSKNDSCANDISDYFHPSMILDPWRQFKVTSPKNSEGVTEKCEIKVPLNDDADNITTCT